MTPPGLRRMVLVGNFLPRRCGIATFTTDLCGALASKYPDMNCFAVPVNDRQEGYAYPSQVYLEISESEIASYERAAEFLNTSDVDLVCLQHEYGIFGGPAGSHILTLLRGLRMPIISTLHTVLRTPNPDQRRVLEEICSLSDRVVVMSQHSFQHLQSIYKVPKEKIDFIPHGIPDVSFVDPNYYKDLFEVEGKTVLSTFGLLSPNKGIENVLKALPAILKERPDVAYIVLGSTHPHVLRQEGESYRMSLKQLAAKLKVQGNVIFDDRFVSLEQLVQFIGATDLYITPYMNVEQSVSGTLAYTVGAGKAIISTPYWYAEELLADGRGMLVPFGDSEAIAAKVLFLLSHDAERHAMRKRAYQLGRTMVWPTVAGHYMESFLKAIEQRAVTPHPVSYPSLAERNLRELPPLKLDHLLHMTDDTGLFQHAVHTVPNRVEGYTTDDNARALAVVARLGNSAERHRIILRNLAIRYLAFLGSAYNPATKRFRNFLSYDRRWLEETGSEDSHGRALWGLGTLIRRSSDEGMIRFSTRLLHVALSPVVAFTSPRSWAFTILGLDEYLKAFPGDRVAQGIVKELAVKLLESYRAHYSKEWPWFEEKVTYANADLSHAILLAGEACSNSEFIEAGLNSLQWLGRIQLGESGQFVPIGCHGFYPQGGTKARFDQQPLEAQSMISACLCASEITGDRDWKRKARRCFDWYLGDNDLRLMVYDMATGGCRDGLHPDRVNQNEGAEATVSFLLSLLDIRPLAGALLRPPANLQDLLSQE